MLLTRRLALVFAMGLAVTACNGTKGPVDERGRPLEALSIVTASGEHKFLVEVVDDDAGRERGLMFRPPLPDDRGMLFEFPNVTERSFWMRNTPSSLDIIYINPQGRIVSIAKHTTPYSETGIPSNGPANGVLELRAGRSDEIGAKAGDQVKHHFFGE